MLLVSGPGATAACGLGCLLDHRDSATTTKYLGPWSIHLARMIVIDFYQDTKGRARHVRSLRHDFLHCTVCSLDTIRRPKPDSGRLWVDPNII